MIRSRRPISRLAHAARSRALATAAALVASTAALTGGASAQEASAPAKGGEARMPLTLEGIELRGNTRTASRVVLRSIRFRPGDPLDVDDPELTLSRYRLLGTGFFSSVQFSLRKGSRRGAVVLVVELVERNTLVVEGLWIGIAADEDTAGNAKPLAPFVGAEGAERNLAGTGVTLGAGVALAEDQLALRTRFAAPALAGSEWTVNGSLLYADARDFFGSRDVRFESRDLGGRALTDYAVVAYRRFGGALGAGRYLTGSLRAQFDYRLEKVDAIVPQTASHLRGTKREPIAIDMLPGTSVLSAVAATLTHDSRDSPVLPKRGYFARASVTASVRPLGSDYGYQKVVLEAARWQLLPWRHVLELSAYAGAIAGDAPFYEQFYVGDLTDLLPSRLLDLAPDRRQPPNLLATDIIEVRYGSYAARLAAEYRVPLYVGRGSIYGVDFFTSFGVLGLASPLELESPPEGYEGFSRVPIDLTYNAGLRVDTSVGGVRLSLSNVIGFLPPRRGDRK